MGISDTDAPSHPAYYVRDGEWFEATTYTRGPWDNRFQHGGPPSALLAGAMERFGKDAPDFQTVRVTSELLRPIPIGRLRVEVDFEQRGRRVQRLHSRLFAHDAETGDKLVATARLLRTRICSVSIPQP